MMVNTWQSKKQFCHCLITLSCSLHCPLSDGLDSQENDLGVGDLLGQEDDLDVGDLLGQEDGLDVGENWYGTISMHWAKDGHWVPDYDGFDDLMMTCTVHMMMI